MDQDLNSMEEQGSKALVQACRVSLGKMAKGEINIDFRKGNDKKVLKVAQTALLNFLGETRENMKGFKSADQIVFAKYLRSGF